MHSIVEAKNDSGTSGSRLDNPALLEVLNDAIETSRSLMESRKQTLATELPSEPLYVNGDLVRLAQVFWNLLNDASKYSSEGSEIIKGLPMAQTANPVLHAVELVRTKRDESDLHSKR